LSDRNISRAFFRERNTVPGLTFIIVIGVILAREIELFFSNYPTLLKIDLFNTIISVFSTFLISIVLSIFVSQLWYLVWNTIYGGIMTGCRFYPFSYLHNTYHIDKDPRNLLMSLHYINSIADGEIRNYLDRRQDVFNLLGSTIVSIIIAIFTGFRLKKFIYYTYINTPNKYFILLYNKNIIDITKYESYLINIFVLFIITSILALIKVVYHLFRMTLVSIHMRKDKWYHINRLRHMDISQCDDTIPMLYLISSAIFILISIALLNNIYPICKLVDILLDIWP